MKRRWETFNSFSADFSHDEKKPCVIGKETLGKISIEYSSLLVVDMMINAYIILLLLSLTLFSKKAQKAWKIILQSSLGGSQASLETE